MQKKILLIEDDAVLSERMASALRQAGFGVLTAFDGEEGLRRVESEHPDLILLDLVLPKVDGLTIAKRLSQDQNLKNIPVIILTVMEKTASYESVLEGTGYEYLVKSDFNVVDLVAKIKEKLHA